MAHGRHDTQARADECRRHFSDQLLATVLGRAEEQQAVGFLARMRRASCALANILDWTDGRRSWRSRRSPSSPCFGWSLPLRFGAGDGIRCWGSARVLGHGYGCPEHILEVAVHFPEDFFGSGDVAFIERLTCHRQALIEAAQLLYQFLTTVLRMRSPGSVDAAQTRAE